MDETRTTAGGALATAGAPPTPHPALSLRGISKSYPGVLALEAIDLDIRQGEVHGLVGENGAGKSTLLKIVTGAHRPTAGTMSVFGEEVSFDDPLAARRCGITAVYQE